MIEEFFKQRSTVARLQSGPMAQQLPSIAEALHQERYPPETIRRYLRVADGLGRWLSEHGLSLAETDETILARYRGDTGRRHTGPLRAAGRGLAKLLALLRAQNAVGEPVRSAGSEGDRLVAAFDFHLQHVTGLMPGTRSGYLRYAMLFVKARTGTESFFGANEKLVSAEASRSARRKASWAIADCVIVTPVSSFSTPGTFRCGTPTP